MTGVGCSGVTTGAVDGVGHSGGDETERTRGDGATRCVRLESCASWAVPEACCTNGVGLDGRCTTGTGGVLAGVTPADCCSNGITAV